MEKTEEIYPSNPKELGSSPLKMGEKGEWLFDQWNANKKNVHNLGATWHNAVFFVCPKEVRYVKLWINIGYEEDGKSEYKRAVLVIKRMWNLFLVIPMTTKEKNNIYHYKLESFVGRSSWLILSQIKTIDKKRYIQKIWEISNQEFKKIKKNLSQYYFSDS